ncbi:MAG TPA: exodeoxyribonuclease III [Polyangia bacterium]|nr:exodeoxyribonuclease III [Polyangia bacterium]
MKIITWNVNGVRARAEQVAELIQREQPDVLCLQEIKVAIDHLPKEIGEVPGYFAKWHGMKGYSGVALHVREAFTSGGPSVWHPEFDHEARIAVAEIKRVAAPPVLVASIYVPNGGKDFPAKIRFLHALTTWAAEIRASGRALVLCGDFNVARAEIDVHPRERNNRLMGQLPEERALFEGLLEAGGLRDVGRDLDPTNDAMYSWWAPWRNMRQRNVGWRLDYVLASAALAARAVSCPAVREFGTSDHGPVIATFAEEATS